MLKIKRVGNTRIENHYFISFAIGWAADNTLTGALSKVREMLKEDGWKKPTAHIMIFKVPGTDQAQYEISFYCPQVKGALLISTEDFVL